MSTPARLPFKVKDLYQGDLGRQIFRIAHMGDIREDDLIRLCTALTGNLGTRL